MRPVPAAPSSHTHTHRHSHTSDQAAAARDSTSDPSRVAVCARRVSDLLCTCLVDLSMMAYVPSCDCICSQQHFVVAYARAHGAQCPPASIMSLAGPPFGHCSSMRPNLQPLTSTLPLYPIPKPQTSRDAYPPPAHAKALCIQVGPQRLLALARRNEPMFRRGHSHSSATETGAGSPPPGPGSPPLERYGGLGRRRLSSIDKDTRLEIMAKVKSGELGWLRREAEGGDIPSMPPL